MYNISFGFLGQGYLNVSHHDSEQKIDPIKVYCRSTLCGKISLLALKFLGLFSPNYTPVEIKLAKDREFKRIGMLPIKNLFISAASYKRILEDKQANQPIQESGSIDVKQMNEIVENAFNVTVKKLRVNLHKGCFLVKKMLSMLLFTKAKQNVLAIIEEFSKKTAQTEKNTKFKCCYSSTGEITFNSQSPGESGEFELEFVKQDSQLGSSYQILFPENFPNSLTSTFQLLHDTFKKETISVNEVFSDYVHTLKKAIWKKEFDFALSSCQYSFKPDCNLKVAIDQSQHIINANKIFFADNQYIAMAYPQYPELFWNMMVQQESSICVKLADDDQYWPNIDDPQLIGGLGVSCVSVITDDNGNKVREFEIQKFDDTGEPIEHPKKVTQFEYRSWPDYGLPDDDFEKFMHAIEKCHIEKYADKGPISVHCQAGQGRTGTFISAYQMMKNPQEIPYTLVDTMRKQRPGKLMVETNNQYVFLNVLKERFLALSAKTIV